MKRFIQKLMMAMVALLMVFNVFANTIKVVAEEMPDEYKEKTKDNYWAELVWYKDSGYRAVIPSYLTDYFASSRVKWVNSLNVQYDPGFPHAGISSDPNLSNDIAAAMNALDVYAQDLPHKEPKDPSLNRWQGGKQWNPYNFDYSTDLVTKNTKDYNVRGDIAERGLSSTAISNHRIGDKINLDFHLDLSLFKKIKNTVLIAIINSEFPAYYMMKNNMPETAITQSDAELVFVLDLPKGLESLDTTKYKLSGIDGFNELSVTKEKSGRRIVVKARLKAPHTYETLKELYKKIQKVKSVTLSVDGLQVTSEVEVNKNNTVTGYAYGVHENIFTTDNDAIFNKDASAIQNDDKHDFFRQTIVYAAKQSVAGRDEAGDVNKPNLMTYTFRVNHKKVIFMNEGTTHATVNVEQGKAIDTDHLTSQSMPSHPNKAGYTFKEWNTAADGTGMKFTGTTVVNQDTTVYAIYSKNLSLMNEAPKLEVKNATIKQGEDFDLFTLIVSAIDKEDGDLKSQVKMIDMGGFDKNKVGKYNITFKVTDSQGASMMKKATITVVKKDHPTLKPTHKTRNPKVGDNTSVLPYVVSMISAGIAFIIMRIKKKEEN